MAENILESKLFRIIILSITGLIVLAFVFGLGIFVGTKRAEFSFKWADEYHRNFGGPQNGFFGDMMGGNFANANGVFGQILKIDASNITVKDRDNLEKVINIADETQIIYQRKTLKITDLKIGDSVVIVGDPTSAGQIQAELIRVMPQAPSNIKPSSVPAISSASAN